jgi:hypothetical protein
MVSGVHHDKDRQHPTFHTSLWRRFLLHHTHTWCICPIATVHDRFGGLGDMVRLHFHDHKWVLCCLMVNFVHLTWEPRFDVTQWNVQKGMERVFDQSWTIKNLKMRWPCSTCSQRFQLLVGTVNVKRQIHFQRVATQCQSMELARLLW